MKALVIPETGPLVEIVRELLRDPRPRDPAADDVLGRVQPATHHPGGVMLDQLDVYVAVRVAFLDRPDVRVCQRDNLLSRGATTYALIGTPRVVGYRDGRPIWDGEDVRFVAQAFDDDGLAGGFIDRECLAACAAELRREFDARIGDVSAEGFRIPAGWRQS